MLGNEQSLLRANMLALVARKSGDAPMKVVTCGGAEIAALMHHQLNSLPEVQMAPVQNADGSFGYMPGWDGPAT